MDDDNQHEGPKPSADSEVAEESLDAMLGDDYQGIHHDTDTDGQIVPPAPSGEEGGEGDQGAGDEPERPPQYEKLSDEDRTKFDLLMKKSEGGSLEQDEIDFLTANGATVNVKQEPVELSPEEKTEFDALIEKSKDPKADFTEDEIALLRKGGAKFDLAEGEGDDSKGDEGGEGDGDDKGDKSEEGKKEYTAEQLEELADKYDKGEEEMKIEELEALKAAGYEGVVIPDEEGSDGGDGGEEGGEGEEGKEPPKFERPAFSDSLEDLFTDEKIESQEDVDYMVDHLVKVHKENEAANAAIKDAMKKDPLFADFIKHIVVDEMDVPLALEAAGYDLEDIAQMPEAKDDPEAFTKIVKKQIELKNRRVKDQERQETFQKNLQNSAKVLEKFNKDNKIVKGDLHDKFIKVGTEIIDEIMEGNYSKTFLQVVWDSISKAKDVAEAEEKGEIKGRNAVIDAKRGKLKRPKQPPRAVKTEKTVKTTPKKDNPYGDENSAAEALDTLLGLK